MAPLGGRFNSNRNGRIGRKGNYIFTLVPPINRVSAIPTFFVCCTSNNINTG